MAETHQERTERAAEVMWDAETESSKATALWHIALSLAAIADALEAKKS